MGESAQFGDLYATVNVRLPEFLSDEERQLYEQLRDIRATAPGDQFARIGEDKTDGAGD